MFRIKARIARNSTAIAKICNAEAGYFGRKIRVHEWIRGSFDNEANFIMEKAARARLNRAFVVFELTR